MLQKGAIPPEKTVEAMETVTRNVQQIAGLVNDILFVQEMDLVLDQFEPVNLITLATRQEPVASRQRVPISLQILRSNCQPGCNMNGLRMADFRIA